MGVLLFYHVLPTFYWILKPLYDHDQKRAVWQFGEGSCHAGTPQGHAQDINPLTIPDWRLKISLVGGF